MALPYIYLLTDLRNNKQYVGKTCGKYRNYFGGGTIIRNIISKFGRKVFSKQVLIEGEFNKEMLNELEKHYIQFYATNKLGYNLTPGGDNGAEYLSKESREKVNNSKKKEVSLLSLKGEHIQDFNSITEVARFIDCQISQVSKSIHNGFAINKTYKVINKGERYTPVSNKRNRMIKTYKNNTLIGTYIGFRDIAKEFNLTDDSAKQAISRGKLAKLNLKFEVYA